MESAHHKCKKEPLMVLLSVFLSNITIQTQAANICNIQFLQERTDYTLLVLYACRGLRSNAENSLQIILNVNTIKFKRGW